MTQGYTELSLAGLLRWNTDWIPDIRAGGTAPASKTVKYGQYVKLGPVTLFAFSISITSSVTSGVITISNLPEDLQGVVAGGTPSVESRIGSAFFHNSGTGYTSYEIVQYDATTWRIVAYSQGGSYISADLANSDDWVGWGLVFTG